MLLDSKNRLIKLSLDLKSLLNLRLLNYSLLNLKLLEDSLNSSRE